MCVCVLYAHIGNFYHGKCNGQGKITFLSGSWYEGTWNDGLMEGVGSYTYSKNDKYQRVRYDGHWERSHRHGHGVLYYKHSGRYKVRRIALLVQSSVLLLLICFI